MAFCITVTYHLSHNVTYHINYTRNFIKIKKTLVDGWTDIDISFIKSTRANVVNIISANYKTNAMIFLLPFNCTKSKYSYSKLVTVSLS